MPSPPRPLQNERDEWFNYCIEVKILPPLPGRAGGDALVVRKENKDQLTSPFHNPNGVNGTSGMSTPDDGMSTTGSLDDAPPPARPTLLKRMSSRNRGFGGKDTGLEAALDMMVNPLHMIDGDGDGEGGGLGSSKAGGGGGGGRGSLVLVNLLRAQEVEASPLFRLVRLLARLEDLSHILIWADPAPGNPTS